MKRENRLNSLSMIFIIALIIHQSAAVQAAPGDLDLSFGIGGKVMTQTGYDDKVYAAAIQPDGKIVVAGTRMLNVENALVARYNANGSIDQSFGVTGGVIDSAHGGHKSVFTAVAIQTDGKIVAAGYYYESGGCPRYQSWAVRYNPNGSHDTTFGNGDGEIEFPYIYFNGCPVNSYHSSLAIQSNGKILIAGTSKNASGNVDFAVTRLNTDGSLDTSFNLDGLATFSIGTSDDFANSIAVQPSGRIVLAGYRFSSLTSNDFALVMLNSQGLYDWNFGGSGKVTTDTGGGDGAYTVAFQSDGKILAAGMRAYVGGTAFSLVRYNINGSLDSSFGMGGKVVTPFGTAFTTAFGIALQSDGKAVVAGRGVDDNAPFTAHDFALSRYNTNGLLDTAFSGDGKQLTDFSNYQDQGRAVVIQADGKVVVAGYSSNGNNDSDIALARYMP